MDLPASDLVRLGWDDSFDSAFHDVAPPHTGPARVIRSGSRTVAVAGEGDARELTLSGRLFDAPPIGGVTTGDWVAVDGDAVLAVLPRRSVLLRHAAGRATLAQAVAANIDTVFVAVPLGTRISSGRVERTLAMVWSSGAVPVILLTKADLSANVDADVAAVAKVAGGASVVATSMAGTGLHAMPGLLPAGRTGAIIGPSGAGKSTLINRLLGDGTIATAPVRADGRGRHTTTQRELLVLPWGGMVIDTPGMREMGVWDAHQGLDMLFANIDRLAQQCRFSDCAHAGEPGCAVMQAAQGDPAILDRLTSLRKLEHEQRRHDLMADARLRAQAHRDIRRLIRSRRQLPLR